MSNKPLPRKFKTALAELAVFPDKLTHAQLALKLREIASDIELDCNIPRSKLLLKIDSFYSDFQKGEFDHPFDLAAVLEQMAYAAWKEFESDYPPSLKIE